MENERIYNWLITGLEQDPHWLSELFYYDKRFNQFFSILVTDYFLFEPDLSLSKGVVSSYSPQTLQELRDKVIRIEAADDIIQVPRLGKGEFDYLQQADSFLNLNAIDANEVTIWDVEEGGSITFNVIPEKHACTKSKSVFERIRNFLKRQPR